METKVVLERYAKYYEFLQKLGNFPLSESPTIEELSLTKGAIQSGYKEMKEKEFKGNLIDYLCCVSIKYLVHLFKMNSQAKKYSPLDFTAYIFTNYFSYTNDIHNLVRLCIRNNDLFFQALELDAEGVSLKIKIDTRYKTYRILSGFYYLHSLRSQLDEKEWKEIFHFVAGSDKTGMLSLIYK